MHPFARICHFLGSVPRGYAEERALGVHEGNDGGDTIHAVPAKRSKSDEEKLAQFGFALLSSLGYHNGIASDFFATRSCTAPPTNQIFASKTNTIRLPSQQSVDGIQEEKTYATLETWQPNLC